MHSVSQKATRQRGNEATRFLTILFAGLLVAPLQAETPPDAVIELWEQHWTLNADGSIVYHSKQHVRLNSDRTYDEFVDPRITYNIDTDELEIINARVKRADGTYRELPDYSHVKVSPNASAGWPAFAGIRQHLIVMSGIEPGCVVELEYKITSKPGTKPCLSGDIRLDHHYPVLERKVGIQTPHDVKAQIVFTGMSESQLKANITGKAEAELELQVFGLKLMHTGFHSWLFTDLPGSPNEPRSEPWQVRCPRFTFSTAGTAEVWLRNTLDRLDAAADDSALIAKLAGEWTKDQFQPADKLRAIQEKLAASFNFVEFDPTWRPAKLRPASETLCGNYGMPKEAAAVFLSLARAAGIPARLGIMTNDDVWMDDVPQRSSVAAYVLLLDSGGTAEIWDAHRGRIMRDDHWANHTLLSINDGKFQRTPLPAWTDAGESRCNIGGTITLAEDGTFTGSMSLRTTGLFVSPESLRSSDAQKSRVNALIHRVLPDAEVESFNVTMLGGGEFAVEAQIKSSEAEKKVGESYWLTLARNGPFMANVSLPLAYSTRTNPVRLTGAFDERIELTIEWPEDWNVEARPRNLESVTGDWGEVEQQVTLDGNRLTVARHTRVTKRQLSADSFLELREPLNTLRTEAARTVVLMP